MHYLLLLFKVQLSAGAVFRAVFDNFFFCLQDEDIVKSIVEHRGAGGHTGGGPAPFTAYLEPVLCRWSDSTGCGIAVGRCWQETLGEAGTLAPTACQTKAPWTPTPPHTGPVGREEQCLPAMGPTSRSTRPPPETTRAMPSVPPSTACWPLSPWTCSSSFTGQTTLWKSRIKWCHVFLFKSNAVLYNLLMRRSFFITNKKLFYYLCSTGRLVMNTYIFSILPKTL